MLLILVDIYMHVSHTHAWLGIYMHTLERSWYDVLHAYMLMIWVLSHVLFVSLLYVYLFTCFCGHMFYLSFFVCLVGHIDCFLGFRYRCIFAWASRITYIPSSLSNDIQRLATVGNLGVPNFFSSCILTSSLVWLKDIYGVMF